MDATTSFMLGPIWTKIIDKLFEYLQDQLRWQAGMKEELERLRENHPKIQTIVSAANQAQIIDQNSALNKWIWQVRDAIDEADDLLDDFEYTRHAEQLVSNNKICSFTFAALDNLRRFGQRAFQIDPYLNKLQKVVQKLDRVSAEITPFLYLIEGAKQEQHNQLVELRKIRETGSSPTDDLLGRVDDKEFIIKWLTEPSNEEHQTHVSTTNLYDNISLLSIVGYGGLGKTTLLQHVYKDERTNEFDLKMWVCVSNNFDAKKVIAGMLESLKKTERDSETLEAFQSKLRSEVKSKKFLLVLDDIWEENEENDISKWQKVIAPLTHGGLGSKILITTRMNSVASMIAKVIKKKKYVFKLQGLHESDCLRLLTTHAFAGVENLDDHKKLRSIVVELVKKLSGSPLGAKVMGGVLNSDLDEKHWRKVLNSNLGQNDIFSILKLSYIFLPKHLQNCFAFCSIFPQDYQFEKDDLIRMWIAVGFIEPSNIQEETLEDIGERYFDVLVNKSFFDKLVLYYTMHDLLHDLAKFVSKQECFRDVCDEKLLLKIPETIRHLSINFSSLKVIGNMDRFKNLRTLRITCDENYEDYADTFNEIFKVTRSIRLLDLKHFNWLTKRSNVILEGIEYLKHLRYFKYNFNVTLLPRSLSKLYHLQFIIYRYICKDCDKDNFFPRDMNNLSNLRYVSYPLLNFSGIGKLVFLQQLEQLYCKNEIGYRIDELKEMNELCILGIYQLENVIDATEAGNAKLYDKKKLTNLSLKWSDDKRNIVNSDLDEKVFDKLQPHKYLKELSVYSYMGVRSAIWLNEAHLIKNLEKIELLNCLEWQILPPFGHIPFLKILRLANMPKVKRLDNKFPGNDEYCDFPSLEKLIISELEALEDWFDARVGCLFPRLTELELKNCPNIQELPYLPPKLEKLEIDNIVWKTLNWCSISTFCSLTNLMKIELRNCLEWQILPPFGHLPFLKILKLANMPKVRRLDNKLPSNDNYCDFTSLKILEISKLEALEVLFDAGDDSWFPCLINLNLHNCPNLQELPYLPPKLEALTVDNIGWKTLNCFSISKSTPPLKLLFVMNCPNIRFISMVGEIGTLAMLKRVQIVNCPNLITLGEHQEAKLTKNCQLILDLLLISDPCVLQMEPLKSVSSVTQMIVNNNNELISFSFETEQWFMQVSSSIQWLKFTNLQSLQFLPSILTSFSSLCSLEVRNLPQLQELPDLPSLLDRLELADLESLQCLPSSLSNISSLNHLELENIPHLKSLPELPPSLCKLYLCRLDNLECLPSCLSTLFSLIFLSIDKVPLLLELPNLPPSLSLVLKECDPKLKMRYKHQSDDFPQSCTIL